MKNAAIVLLLAICAFLLWRLAYVENQRHAMITGTCRYAIDPRWQDCLRSTQTRTSWIWNAYYGAISD